MGLVLGVLAIVPLTLAALPGSLASALSRQVGSELAAAGLRPPSEGRGLAAVPRPDHIEMVLHQVAMAFFRLQAVALILAASYAAVLCAADGAYGQHPAGSVPDRLVVTRTKPNINNPAAAPFSKTLDHRSLVAELYADISALPPPPSGPLHCPLDLGISYHLNFEAAGVTVLSADYQPSGCAVVRLSDGTVKSDATGILRKALQGALGFPSERAFLGFS